MKKQRKRYSAEYKIEATKLVTEGGYSIPQACVSLGIGETALRRWIAQVKSEANGELPKGCKPLTDEQKRIRDLE